MSGRLFLDLSDALTSARDLYWGLAGVPNGTEVIIRVGRVLPVGLSGCFPEVDVVPRIHLTIEGPDSEAVRTAVCEFRAALAQWAEQTDAARAERREREAQQAADRAWFQQRRQAVVG